MPEREKAEIKIFVTGVGGQLNRDVMNGLYRRGYMGVGSDIAPCYSGIRDGSAICTMPYVQMDITDAFAVEKVLPAWQDALTIKEIEESNTWVR